MKKKKSCYFKTNLIMSFAIALFGLMGNVGAVTIDGSSKVIDIDVDYYESLNVNFIQNKELKEVIRLVKAGKTEDAKLKVARFLVKQEMHSIANEIAGTILLKEKKYEAANASFLRANYTDKNNSRILSKLGVSFLLLRKMNDGEKLLKDALKINPNEELSLVYLGWLSHIRGNSLNAIDYYERTINLTNRNHKKPSRTLAALTALYNSSGRYQATLDVSKHLLKKDIKSFFHSEILLNRVNALIVLKKKKAAKRLIQVLKESKFSRKLYLTKTEARIHFSFGKIEDAVNVLQKALIKDKVNKGKYYAEIANMYRIEGRLNDSFDNFQFAIESSDSNNISPLLVSYFRIASTLNKTKQALSFSEKKIKKIESNPEIQYQIALAKFFNSNFNGSLKLINVLLGHYPEFQKGLALKGKIERYQKKYTNAINSLRKSIKNNYSDKGSWIDYAGLYVDQGDYDKAGQVLQQAISLNKDDERLRSSFKFELASIKDMQNKNNEAITLYESVIKIMPNHLPSVNNLALNYITMKKNAKALALINSIDKSLMIEPYFLDTYGWVLLNNKKFDEAFKTLKKVVQKGNISGYINYHYALALYHTGKTSDAKEYFTSAKKSKELDSQSQRNIDLYLKDITSGSLALSFP